MSSFLRIAGAAALVLGLGLVVRALPLGDIGNIQIHALNSDHPICLALNHLLIEADIVAKLRACLNVSTLAELEIAIGACVNVIKVCADALAKIGAGAAVDAAVQVDIVAFVSALVTLIVKVCLQLTVKFGVSVVATLCAELDVCVRLLLANLNICVFGIVDLIVKACVDVTASVLVQVNLLACAKLFV